MTLGELNALSDDAAASELVRCCGSTRWARRMASARPFADRAALAAHADGIWTSLDRDDWLEAFAAHPRIGGAGTAGTDWSAREQSGVTDDSRAKLTQLNLDYERRFGYIFIVCATGRSGAEMIAILERRMRNNPDAELGEAAEEQRKITRLRLDKLVTEP